MFYRPYPAANPNKNRTKRLPPQDFFRAPAWLATGWRIWDDNGKTWRFADLHEGANEGPTPPSSSADTTEDALDLARKQHMGNSPWNVQGSRALPVMRLEVSKQAFFEEGHDVGDRQAAKGDLLAVANR